MSNRTLGWGCGIAAVLGLLACGGVIVGGWYFVRSVATPMIAAGAKMVETEANRQSLATNWQPPGEGADPQTWFPAQVGDYALESQDDQAAIPELQIEAPGRHAVYGAGDSHIEVYLTRTTSQETDAIFNRVKSVYDSEQGQGGTRSWSTIRLSEEFAHAYLQSPQLGQNQLWFVKDWLLVFRTKDSVDREEFVLNFLGASAAKTTTPAEATETNSEADASFNY